MSDLPATLQQIADDFAELEGSQRLQLLLEFSNELPALPDRYAEHPELMEPVPECQSPIFLAVEVDGASGTVHLHFSAPPEAPTTRGFAGILHEGLNGLHASDLLAVPDDLPNRLSLSDQVSLLRLRGMAGMLARIKAQVARQLRAHQGL